MPKTLLFFKNLKSKLYPLFRDRLFSFHFFLPLANFHVILPIRIKIFFASYLLFFGIKQSDWTKNAWKHAVSSSLIQISFLEFEYQKVFTGQKLVKTYLGAMH